MLFLFEYGTKYFSLVLKPEYVCIIVGLDINRAKIKYVIKILENTRAETGKEIRSLFQVSYKIEASILKADYFPPLNRPLKSFLTSENEFYGYIKSKELVAAVELKHSNHNCHIQSLVVHPNHFRLGIGTELIKFVIQKEKTKTITVETGFDNLPACALYRSLNFIENGWYDTEFNIRKIKFILHRE